MKTFRQFLSRVKTSGRRRREAVKTVAMGRERTFDAFDVGDDTYVIERGIASRLDERPSVLVVEKSKLRRHGCGRVFTITTGNHSVAAFPLLDGRFWKLSKLAPPLRGETLVRDVICANVVDDVLEISQRDVSTDDLVAADRWLLESAGFSMRDVVMTERNDATLDVYKKRGQEWRVKPLAWTEKEMLTALDASRKRISTGLRYYHSSKGVHFLSFQEFSRFSGLAQTAPDEFIAGLRERVSVYEGNQTSFTRMPKHRGHHEIELFGLRRGVGLDRIDVAAAEEHGIPVRHRIHGDLKVTRVEAERFFADSDSRKDLMFPYKYFDDGLLTLPEEEKSSGGAW